MERFMSRGSRQHQRRMPSSVGAFSDCKVREEEIEYGYVYYGGMSATAVDTQRQCRRCNHYEYHGIRVVLCIVYRW